MAIAITEAISRTQRFISRYPPERICRTATIGCPCCTAKPKQRRKRTANRGCPNETSHFIQYEWEIVPNPDADRRYLSQSVPHEKFRTNRGENCAGSRTLARFQGCGFCDPISMLQDYVFRLSIWRIRAMSALT